MQLIAKKWVSGNSLNSIARFPGFVRGHQKTLPNGTCEAPGEDEVLIDFYQNKIFSMQA